MMLPMGRRHQIDYMFGLRYAFSPTYRDRIRKSCSDCTSLKVFYMLGGFISITVVLSALGLLTLVIQGLLH